MQITLNYYSFGYASGLINDSKNKFDKLKLNNLVDITKNYNLSGVEFPFDKIFSIKEINKGIEEINNLIKSDIKLFIDFEKIDQVYLREVIPKLANVGINIFRIKMNHIGKVFYGGNRYSCQLFKENYEKFSNDLIELLPILKDYNSIAVIENHQDLHSEELRAIIENISAEHFGVNWDIGNSFSVCDTPETFFKNCKHLIKNVHLKDYYIRKSLKGMYLTRCPIGSGAVDFNDIFQKLDSLDKRPENLSIELGAHISRECDISLDEYWKPYSNLDINKKDYIENINSLLINKEKSAYEDGLRGDQLIKSEYDEVVKSIHQVKKLAKDSF